jgi:hypothetical protein
VARTERPIDVDKVTIAVFQLIMLHQDKPCPTRRDIMEITGIPRRKIWPQLNELADRGLIEIETVDPDPDRREMPRRYRMRVINGRWTDWTDNRLTDGRRFVVARA